MGGQEGYPPASGRVPWRGRRPRLTGSVTLPGRVSVADVRWSDLLADSEAEVDRLRALLRSACPECARLFRDSGGADSP